MPTWRPPIGMDLPSMPPHWPPRNASVAKIMQWARESKMQFSFHLSTFPQIESSWILTKQTRCHVLFSLVEAQTLRPTLIHIWRLSCFPALFLSGFMIISRAKRASAENPLFSGNNNVNYLMSTAKRARDDRGCWACRGRELRFVISKVETQ